ncbi:unnamed protein product, partial [Pylaiella littoralis]
LIYTFVCIFFTGGDTEDARAQQEKKLRDVSILTEQVAGAERCALVHGGSAALRCTGCRSVSASCGRKALRSWCEYSYFAAVTIGVTKKHFLHAVGGVSVAVVCVLCFF